MEAQSLSTLWIALLVGASVPAWAQDAEPANPPSEEPPAEEEEPPVGARPVEDPDLHHDQPQATDEPPPTDGEPEAADAPEEDKGPDVKATYDRGFLLSIDNWFFLALNGLVQARYTVNYRTEPPTDPLTLEREKQVTQGFDVPRARFTLGIGLTEFVAMVMRIGVVAGGTS